MIRTVSRAKRTALIALAGISALTVAACGGSDDPAAVAEDFVEAGLNGDAEAVCDLFSAELVDQATGGEDCAEALGADAEEASDEEKEQFESASFETIEETEGAATVEVSLEGEDPETIELVNEDGDWKVASIPGL